MQWNLIKTFVNEKDFNDWMTSCEMTFDKITKHTFQIYRQLDEIFNSVHFHINTGFCCRMFLLLLINMRMNHFQRCWMSNFFDLFSCACLVNISKIKTFHNFHMKAKEIVCLCWSENFFCWLYMIFIFQRRFGGCVLCTRLDSTAKKRDGETFTY